MAAIHNNNFSLHQYLMERRALTVLLWGGLLTIEFLAAFTVLVSPLSAALIFVLITIMIFFIKPEYALFNLVFWVVPGRCLRLLIGPFELTISHLSVIVALISCGIAVMAKTRSPYSKSTCDLPMILFGGWAVLSLLWSHDQMTGIHNLIRLLISLSAFFIIIATVKTRRTLMILFGVFMLMGIIDACLTIYYPFSEFYYKNTWEINKTFRVLITFWQDNMLQPEGRGRGFNTPHNTSAIMIIPITFTAMLFSVTYDITKRRLLMFVLLLLYAACTATFAKGSIGGLIFGVAFLCYYLKPLRRRFLTTMLITFIATVFFFCLTRLKGLGMALTRVGIDMHLKSDNPDGFTAVGNRVEAWTIGAQKLWDTAWMGTGIGGFNQYLPTKWIDGAHPVTLFDFGLVGFVLYLWVIATTYHFIMQSIKTSQNEYFRRLLIVYLAGYVAILVTWVTSFSYIHLYLWLYIGVGFAISRLSDSAQASSDQKLPFYREGDSIVNA